MSSNAGWYPDPGGQPGLYRYWTGTAWTEAITPTPANTPPPDGFGQPFNGPGVPGTGYENYSAAKPARRGAPAWWVAALAALVVVALVIAFALRTVTGVSLPGLPGSAPTATFSPDICPSSSDQTALPTAEVPAGWISSGRLAFPAMGGEWQVQYDNRVPWGSLAMEEIVVVEADYDGVDGQNWVASVLVSDLYVGDGFASTQVAAETVLDCVLGIYYSDTNVTQALISSSATEVDGHNGWLIETQLSFTITGLESTGERVLLLVVQTDTDEYGLFYASIPDTRSDLLPAARQAMAELQVSA